MDGGAVAGRVSRIRRGNLCAQCAGFLQGYQAATAGKGLLPGDSAGKLEKRPPLLFAANTVVGIDGHFEHRCQAFKALLFSGLGRAVCLLRCGSGAAGGEHECGKR